MPYSASPRSSSTMDFPEENFHSVDPITQMRPNIGSSIYPGRKPSYGFLQKLFSRQPGTSKIITEGLEDQTGHTQFNSTEVSSLIDLKVMPCPYIRPLGKRLEPRIESAPLAPQRRGEGPGRLVSRKRQEAPCANRSYLSLHETNEVHQRNTPVVDIISVQSLMLQENIASAAAADVNCLKEWDYYIKCYSEGRYSMNVPPVPPPKSSTFTYLPSTYPPNEIDRLATFQSSQIWSGTDIEWSNLEIEGARSLITAAMKIFATPCAAISFFDRDSEIVQAERGYSRHLIPRHESIASHVVLTNEVMTVLDTEEDWRFSGNPLVVGNPNIRFFAGAPLLSANSQVIGVFSIFGPEPRANFTAVQRRDLLGLSELATRKLTARSGLLSSRELQASTILHPGSWDVSATNSHTPTLRPPMSLETDLCKKPSVAFRYHKLSQNGLPRSRLIIKPEGRDTHIADEAHTPPSSDNSDAGGSHILPERKGFGKNCKQLSLVTLPYQPPNDMRTPNSPTSEIVSPNSASLLLDDFPNDLDYLSPASNPYRVDSFNIHDSVEFIARSRRHGIGFSSDDAAVLLTPTEHDSDTTSFSVSSEGRETLLEEALLFGERLDAAFTDGNEMVLSSTPEPEDLRTKSSDNQAIPYRDTLDRNYAIRYDLKPQKAHDSSDIQAEARFAAELWAKNLELDAIYVVELISKRNTQGFYELVAPSDFETRLLIAHGLPDLINFDIPIHLDVLRGSGAITWENKNALPDEYSRGFMMPLLFEDGILDRCSSGVVFGAFRKRPEKLRTAEVERLQRVANVLMDILSKWPSLRRPGQAEVELLQCSRSHSPLVNEAIKVSKMSFDAGMATCARRKRPKSPVRWQLGGSD